MFREESVELVFRYSFAAIKLRDAALNSGVDGFPVLHQPAVLLLLRLEQMEQGLLGLDAPVA